MRELRRKKRNVRTSTSHPARIGILVIVVLIVSMTILTSKHTWVYANPDLSDDVYNVVLEPVNENRQVHGSGAGYEVLATVTAYSEFDSCHTGKSCLMANGKRAHIGAVACPRRLKMGSYVEIQGRRYQCSDRTAKWTDGRYDIFTGFGQEGYDKAIHFGKKQLTVRIEL